MQPHEQARALSDAILERAEDVLPTVDWRPATVIGYNRSTLAASVVLDEDTALGGPNTEVASTIGDVGPQQRVMVMRVNGNASAITGRITSTPWQEYQPALVRSSDGLGGPSLGQGATQGRWRIVDDEAQVRIQWLFGTGCTANPATSPPNQNLGVNWCFQLPVPVTGDWGNGNEAIGHGWAYVVYSGNGWLYHLEVDAPFGLANNDPLFAGMRATRADANPPSGGTSGVVGTAGNLNTGVPLGMTLLQAGTKITLSLRYPAG